MFLNLFHYFKFLFNVLSNSSLLIICDFFSFKAFYSYKSLQFLLIYSFEFHSILNVLIEHNQFIHVYYQMCYFTFSAIMSCRLTCIALTNSGKIFLKFYFIFNHPKFLIIFKEFSQSF